MGERRESHSQRMNSRQDIEEVVIQAIVATLKRFFGRANGVRAQRADAVEQTIVMLHHEINNPLTVVLGNAELILMKSDHLPAETIARLEKIVQAGLKIKNAVTNLNHTATLRSTTYVDNVRMIDIRDRTNLGDADFAP